MSDSMMTWLESYGTYWWYYINMVYWIIAAIAIIVIAVAAIWAAITFAKYVKFLQGSTVIVEEGVPAAFAEAPVVAPAGSDVIVDEFVD